jgi:phosphoribosylformylglycinamidine synthase subunit PurS
MTTATVIILPKRSVLDPQGVAVKHALQQLDLPQATQVRVGKFIEITLDGKESEALQAKLETVCREFLSNPVIEDYALYFSESASREAEKKEKAEKEKKKAKKEEKKKEKKAEKILKAVKVLRPLLAASAPTSAKVKEKKKEKEKVKEQPKEKKKLAEIKDLSEASPKRKKPPAPASKLK